MMAERAPIDFRKSRWGHTMHVDTWERHDDGHQSVMVHSSVVPEEGDQIIYSVSGGDRVGTIIDVEHCSDPRDMFTLHYRTDTTAGEGG